MERCETHAIISNQLMSCIDNDVCINRTASVTRIRILIEIQQDSITMQVRDRNKRVNDSTLYYRFNCNR